MKNSIFKLLYLLLLFSSCDDTNIEGKEILLSELFNHITSCSEIDFEHINGDFVVKSEDTSGLVKRVFVSDEPEVSIRYYQQNNAGIPDTLLIGINQFELPKLKQLNTSLMSAHRFTFNKKKFIVFDSQLLSANGFSVTRHFYILFEYVDSNYKMVDFFESRFGSIENIGEFTCNGKLDFVELSLDSKKKLNISIKEIGNRKNAKKIGKLTYLGNDIFEVEKIRIKEGDL